jgi:hypothetical protein
MQQLVAGLICLVSTPAVAGSNAAMPWLQSRQLNVATAASPCSNTRQQL